MSLEWYILATGVKCKISSNRDCQEKQIYVSSMTGINIFPTLQRQVKISFQSHELSVSSSSQNYNIYKSYMAFFILSVHNRLEAQMINSLTREIKVTECILYKYCVVYSILHPEEHVRAWKFQDLNLLQPDSEGRLVRMNPEEAPETVTNGQTRQVQSQGGAAARQHARPKERLQQS